MSRLVLLVLALIAIQYIAAHISSMFPGCNGHGNGSGSQGGKETAVEVAINKPQPVPIKPSIIITARNSEYIVDGKLCTLDEVLAFIQTKIESQDNVIIINENAKALSIDKLTIKLANIGINYSIKDK